MPALNNILLWLSTPNHLLVEIAIAQGFRGFVLDIEHGVFDVSRLDTFVAYCRAADVSLFAKVAAPRVEAIQQMLDRGCHGIIIPHVGGLDDAARLAGAVKYPPVGTRSFDGGRTSGFAAPDGAYFEQCNSTVMSIPMIETTASLAAVAEIARLPAVDALFVGPYDLSLDSGRGPYRKSEEDEAALERIASAARDAGKEWWMPAWTPVERHLASSLGASHLVVAEELGLFQDGLVSLQKELVVDSQ